jgi:hypothetical protein
MEFLVLDGAEQKMLLSCASIKTLWGLDLLELIESIVVEPQTQRLGLTYGSSQLVHVSAIQVAQVATSNSAAGKDIVKSMCGDSHTKPLGNALQDTVIHCQVSFAVEEHVADTMVPQSTSAIVSSRVSDGTDTAVSFRALLARLQTAAAECTPKSPSLEVSPFGTTNAGKGSFAARAAEVLGHTAVGNVNSPRISGHATPPKQLTKAQKRRGIRRARAQQAATHVDCTIERAQCYVAHAMSHLTLDAPKATDQPSWKQVAVDNLETIIQNYDKNTSISEAEVEELLAPYRTEEDIALAMEMDPEPTEAFDLLDQPDQEELNSIFTKAIDTAVKEMELEPKEKDKFTKLLTSFKDVFSLRMGLEVPASVEPLKVELTPGARPLRVKMRSYSPEDRAFLRETCDEMVKLGLLYHNKNARWVAPVGVVPKPGSTKKRMVVDLRWINSQTVPIQYGMPVIEDQLPAVKGAKYFFTGDFLKGFWQVMIDKECQHLFSFMTPDGVYTPTRLPMGAVDSPLYFQAVIEDIFRPLIREGKLLLWIDDILAVAKTFSEFLVVLQTIFGSCREYGLKLNIEKCVLGAFKAEWCGRTVTGAGCTMKSRRAQAFVDMPCPQTAGDLGEFLHALNWMRSSIPRFQEKSQILWDQLSRAKKFLLEFDKRIRTPAMASKKKNYSKVRLEHLGWSDEHTRVFEEIKATLADLTELAHFDPNDLQSTVCLLTDASQTHYSALVTQVEKWDPSLPIEQQAHEPLGSFNGAFTGSAVSWSTIEKEAYPIIKALTEFRYFLSTSKGFRLYTDHANLVHLFRPDNLNPPLSTAAMDKVYRWLYALSHFRVVSMQHLPGARNLWPDLLTRWGHQTYRRKERGIASAIAYVQCNNLRNAAHARRHGQVKNEFLHLYYDPAHTSFEFPTLEKIREAQERAAVALTDAEIFVQKPHLISSKDDVIHFNERVWIPSTERFMILCIMLTGHDSACGHLSHVNTSARIRKRFYWNGMNKDIQLFMEQCLSCIKTKTGKIIPRPWGESVSATGPNQVLHFDYLYIDKPKKKSTHMFEYILVLKDDFTGYTELIPCEHADHVNVVQALQAWGARFGLPHTLVSDRGSHFFNRILDEYVRRSYPQEIHHHFTVAYAPWSNGTVERLMRHILEVFRRLVHRSDKIDMDAWPYLIPHVMSVVNGTPQAKLQNHSPRELFVNPFVCSDTLLDLFYDPHADVIDTVVSSEGMEQYYEKLIEALQELHKKVIPLREETRKRNRRNLHVVKPVNFAVGDFVLVAIVSKKARKLHATWRGPYRVLKEINSHVYECEDLTLNITINVHVRRMKFFANCDLDVTVPLLEEIHAQDTWITTAIPECVLDSIQDDTNHVFVRVKWMGFSELESTWEPIEAFYEDAPALVDVFVGKNAMLHKPLAKFVSKQKLSL